jgi:hypothetical protein
VLNAFGGPSDGKGTCVALYCPLCDRRSNSLEDVPRKRTTVISPEDRRRNAGVSFLKGMIVVFVCHDGRSIMVRFEL